MSFLQTRSYSMVPIILIRLILSSSNHPVTRVTEKKGLVRQGLIKISHARADHIKFLFVLGLLTLTC